MIHEPPPPLPPEPEPTSRFESVSLCAGKLTRVGAADYGFCGGAFVAVLRADDDPEGDCAAGFAEAHGVTICLSLCGVTIWSQFCLSLCGVTIWSQSYFPDFSKPLGFRRARLF